jgi:GNAT superfamily N-acetyltransferase
VSIMRFCPKTTPSASRICATSSWPIRNPKRKSTLNCDAFFDFDSVKGDDVGCLSQFYIRDGYRGKGIGSVLFEKSMKWLRSFKDVSDLFIFVSNGNDDALRFYLGKGFKVNHDILDGFITVLRDS